MPGAPNRPQRARATRSTRRDAASSGPERTVPRCGTGSRARVARAAPSPALRVRSRPGARSRAGSLIAAGVWILISFVAFAVSAQIQKSKLDDDAAAELGGFPFLLAQGQNILVIGTDIRQEGVPDENGNPTTQKCIDAASSGAVHPEDCVPSRADTLMVVHAGGGSFNKVSIPRDTLASIPGVGDEKINSAYAFGGRGAADQDGRGLPRDRHQPRRDPRLRGLRRLHRLDRRGHGRTSRSRSTR